jgi:hypothetical protein
LALWLSAIAFCLNQYKSLRRLETQVHYCVNRKDPLNIGDIKIVTREQDSIIYKKKRYSTLLDTPINSQQLKAMQYVQQYLPKSIPSALSALVINRNDLSTTNRFDSLNNTHHQITSEYLPSIPYFRTDMESIKRNIKISRTGKNHALSYVNFFVCYLASARCATGLTIPRISQSSSSHSSWNEINTTQHLGIPINDLGSNCYSVGDMSLPVPNVISKSSDEQLLDPRLISETVRRSLLALHRESQENVNMLKKKDKTRSENDVHRVLTTLKSRIKIKSKCTQQQFRPHSNTLSILPQQMNSNDHDYRILENQSTPLIRRSLIHYPKSSIESETIQNDTSLIMNVSISTDEDESSKIVIEKSS